MDTQHKKDEATEKTHVKADAKEPTHHAKANVGETTHVKADAKEPTHHAKTDAKETTHNTKGDTEKAKASHGGSRST